MKIQRDAIDYELPVHDDDGSTKRLDAWIPETSVLDYIMSNPPFVGASMMSAVQKAEAIDKAHVHVVVIGFHAGDETTENAKVAKRERSV